MGKSPLPDELRKAVMWAAEWHDHGKRRKLFQRVLGNLDSDHVWWAKSGKKGSRLPEIYRHEFGSLLDVARDCDLSDLSDEMKDVVFHLIAVHHGRGRPHFSRDEAFDPDPRGGDVGGVAGGVARGYARV